MTTMPPPGATARRTDAGAAARLEDAATRRERDAIVEQRPQEGGLIGEALRLARRIAVHVGNIHSGSVAGCRARGLERNCAPRTRTEAGRPARYALPRR